MQLGVIFFRSNGALSSNEVHIVQDEIHLARARGDGQNKKSVSSAEYSTIFRPSRKEDIIY